MYRLVPLFLAAALTGCATFDRNEIASIRERSVAPPVVEKLERGHALSPADVIELSRRHVPEEWIVRQLEDHDVDSLVTRRDVVALRRANVSPSLIDTLLKASDRFQDPYRYPAYGSVGFGYGDPWGPYDSYPYYGYGGIGASFVVPIRGGGHHHHRH